MRARYKEGTNEGVQIPGMKKGSTEITMDYRNQPGNPQIDSRFQRRLDLINRLSSPNLDQFLIDFGLNLASGVPRGNIFQQLLQQLLESHSLDLWKGNKKHNKQKQL